MFNYFRNFTATLKVLVILSILFGSVFHPSPSLAESTITVNTTNDELNTDGDCSLREAIQAANDDAGVDACTAGSGVDSITIPAGTYTLTIGGIDEDTNATGDFDIVTSLNITGNDASTTVIRAGATSVSGIDRIFDIFGATSIVSISGVTIANGYSEGVSGGAIYMGDDSALTVTNSTFLNNYADGEGGVIYNGTGTLTVTNSTFSSNSAYCGGGIYNQGGVVDITGSTFSDNSVECIGGGIYNIGTMTVATSTFSDNSAAHQGGGIANDDDLTVTNSTFSGNSAYEGGGIYNYQGDLTITNGTFSDNDAEYGGGIYNYLGDLNLQNTILANSVSGEDCYNDSGTISTNINNLIETNGIDIYMCEVPALTDDPSLGELTGSPAYFPLNSDSPAINAGDDSICAASPVNNISQNGVFRPQGSHCDLGSYEFPGKFGTISQWTTSFDLSHDWTVDDYVRTVGDVNNDGMDDLVGFGQDGVYVALSTGSGFGAISRWTTSFDLSHGWTVADYVRTVGDVNNDGRADLIGFGQDGVYVALSTGSNFGPISRWTTSFDLSHGWTVDDYVRTVGDVNNDGRADLIGFGQDGVYVALSTGSGFGAVSRWTTSFDLSHGWTVDDYVRTVGDVNNDGMDDLVGFGQDGVYVAISTGSGFGPISQWTTSFDLSHGWTVADYVRTVGDVNNDGMNDLVGFGQDGVYVALSTGSGFSPISQWTTSFDLSHGWTVDDYVRTVGDINGDGRVDLVGFGLDGVYVALSE